MRKRIRKTKDQWELHTNYGYGWEVECIEESRKEILARQKEYRENAGHILKGLKVRMKRVRLTCLN